MKGKVGHVVDIRPNGYISIQGTVDTVTNIETEEIVNKIFFDRSFQDSN
jgi:hypothetical protein